MLTGVSRRVGWSPGAVVAGWLVSLVGAVPVAYFGGIWLSGWEEPESYIVQGAETNPLYSGAGPTIVWSFVVLVGLVTVFWGSVFLRGRTR